MSDRLKTWSKNPNTLRYVRCTGEVRSYFYGLKFIARKYLWMSLKLCQLVHPPPNADMCALPFYSHIFEREGTMFLYHCHVFPQSRGLDN
jgi:hypothetical protein